MSRLYSKKQCFYYVFVVVSWEDMLWMMMYFPFFSSGGEREKGSGVKRQFFFLQDNGCVCDSMESINCASC